MAVERNKNKRIPAYLSFDVEPDGFQLSRTAPPPWTGYEFCIEYAQELRDSLAARTGEAPRFGWYFRTDPQIAEVYGRADHILARYPERIERLEALGDYFGVHNHPVRWCEQREVWIHDIADTQWLAQCTRSSLDAFAAWRGAPVERYRAGAGFLANTIVATLDDCGVKIDLTLEPVTGWGVTEPNVNTAVDHAPLVGTYTDCDGAPRAPYRPSRDDFRVPAGKRDGRAMIMVPLTTYVPETGESSWGRFVGMLAGRPKPRPQVLYPCVNWPDPGTFWDLAERELATMREPYLSLAVRTDAADSALVAAARRILDALAWHPLGERLQFIDPLEHLSPRMPH